MGSKKFMLRNGLGELIRDQLQHANRFVDPFCGSGSVVYFVAQNFDKQIIACDLQEYAVVLANAVISRTQKTDTELLKKDWLDIAEKKIQKSKLFLKATNLDKLYSKNIRKWVKESRKLCETKSIIGPVWNAYGGHYFSPKQSLTFDYLIKTLPQDKELRNLCLASVIGAASKCAASPGHTAQPFQPTKTAKKFIKDAWEIDVIKSCESILEEIAKNYAKTKGIALVSSAQQITSTLMKGDLVIVDPPYSGVQYSRFYHVLETIARGKCGSVSGVGRYPAWAERPQSEFSNISTSIKALEDLMSGLIKKEVTVIFTFPKGKCSNGLSGEKVREIAEKWFNIDGESRTHEHPICGKFSTMGGNNKTKIKGDRVKAARIMSEEIILLLKPKTNVDITRVDTTKIYECR